MAQLGQRPCAVRTHGHGRWSHTKNRSSLVAVRRNMPLFDHCWEVYRTRDEKNHHVGVAASKADYGTAWDKQGVDEAPLTMGDLLQMSRNDTLRFIRDNFWSKIYGDEIAKASTEITAFLFFCSLHHGPQVALEMLCSVLHRDFPVNIVAISPLSMHPKELAAIVAQTKDLLVKLMNERQKFYHNLVLSDPQTLIFEKKWAKIIEEDAQQARAISKWNQLQLSEIFSSTANGAEQSSSPFPTLGNIQGLYIKYGLVSCVFDNNFTDSRGGKIFAGSLLNLGNHHFVRFSLDPWEETNPRGPFLRKVYDPPEIAGTVLGDIFFEADFLLKKLSMGLEPIPSDLVEKGLMSMMDMTMPHAKQHIFSRLWFYIADVKIHETADGIDVFDVVLAVDARRNAQSSTGKLIDVPTTEDCNEARFAQTFTRLFADAKRHFPIFQDLEEACRCTVLVHLLKNQHLSLDKEQLKKWAASPSPHEYKIDALKNESISRTTTTAPNPKGNGEIRTTHTTTRFMFGDISCEIPEITRLETARSVFQKQPDRNNVSNPTPVIDINKPSVGKSRVISIRTSSGLATVQDIVHDKANSKDTHILTSPKSITEPHILEHMNEVQKWLHDLQYETPPTTLHDLVYPLQSHNYVLHSREPDLSHPLNNEEEPSGNIFCVSHLQTRKCSHCHERIENMDDATQCRLHDDQTCAFCFYPITSPSPSSSTGYYRYISSDVQVNSSQTKTQKGPDGSTITVTSTPYISAPQFGYTCKAHRDCFRCFACNQPITESFVTISTDNGNNDINHPHTPGRLFFHPHCPVTREIQYPKILYPTTWTCLYCSTNDYEAPNELVNLYPHDTHCRQCGRARGTEVTTIAKDLYLHAEYVSALNLYMAAANSSLFNMNKDSAEGADNSNSLLNTKRLAALQANICLCHVKMRDFNSALSAINNAVHLLDTNISKITSSAKDSLSKQEERAQYIGTLSRYWLKRADIFMALSQWHDALDDFQRFLTFARSANNNNTGSSSGGITNRNNAANNSEKLLTCEDVENGNVVDEKTLQIVYSRIEECQKRLSNTPITCTILPQVENLPLPQEKEYRRNSVFNGKKVVTGAPTAGQR